MNTTEKSSDIAVKRTIGISLFLVFLGLMIWATVAIGKPLINTLFGDGSAEEFRAIVDRSPVVGRLIFIGIQILQVFVALIPGEAVELAAGVVFGTWEGLALSLFGVLIGSVIIFTLTRTLGIRFVELFVDRKKINEISFLKDQTKLDSIVFLIFFIPGTPKDLLTYFVGLTNMKLGTFLLIAMTARIPSILTSTWCGNELIEGNYTKSIIIFAVTGVIGITGLLLYNRAMKKKNASPALSDEDE